MPYKDISSDDSRVLELTPPVSRGAFNRLNEGVDRVCLDGVFPERDYQRLGEWFAGHRDATLFVGFYRGERTLDFLRHFPTLRRFELHSYNLRDASGLKSLPDDLERLHLGAMLRGSIPLGLIERFDNLKELWIEGHERQPEALSNLRNLQRLSLRSCTFDNLQFLTPLRQLRWLEIKLGGTTNLEVLPELKRLEYLELWMIRGLADLSSLGNSTLKWVFLESQPRVAALPDMRHMHRLCWLYIDKLKGLRDYSPLRMAPALEDLYVFAPGADSALFRPLERHPTLRRATIGVGSRKRDAVIQERLKLPPAKPVPEFRLVDQ